MKGFDAIIVGSGLIGLSCAWRLSERGRRVAVYDPMPGQGASAIGAGMLAPVTEASWHDTTLIDLNMRAARDWPKFAEDLEKKSGRGIGFRSCGTIYAAFDPSDKAALEEICEFERSLGLEATWCAPSRLRSIEPLLAPSVRGGIWAPGEHQVDNRLFFAALAHVANLAGVRIVNERVDSVITDAGCVRGVRVGDEAVAAPLVVLAAGHAVGRIGGLPSGVVPEIRPVKGQILRLMTRNGSRFADATVRALVNGSTVYVVSRDDGGVVVGATQEEKGEDVSIDAGALYRLLRDAQHVVPGIEDLEISEFAAGLRPAARHHQPVIGAASIDGLVLALGHFRNGILLADVTGQAVSALAETGALPPWCEPFAPARPVREVAV
ncbi:MAG: glycine oxidase ThiO [Acidimicrobiales bacterium]